MSKLKNAPAWTELGYSLFAEEGLDGIQIERLARILQLNKSGFYHYFGDIEVFCEELLLMHERKADIFYDEIKNIKSIDPEYFQKVVDHKVMIMFQVQLYHSKSKPAFYNLAEKIDEKEGPIIQDMWNDYLGFGDNTDLAIRYFIVVRDMAYRRLSLQNMTCDFLRTIFTEAKEIINQMSERNSSVETKKY